MSAATQLRQGAEAIAAATPDVHKPSTPSVHEAWLAVMDEVRVVAKDGKYEAGKTKYNFRGVDGVVNAVGPAVRNHRVHIRPLRVEATYRDAEAGTNRTLMRECTVNVTYRVTGPAGDYFDGEGQGEALDSSDKGSAKAQSVAYRVFLLQALCIPTMDPDPDEARHERSSAPEPPFVWTRGACKTALLNLLDRNVGAAEEAWALGHGDEQEPSADLAARLAEEWKANQPKDQPPEDES